MTQDSLLSLLPIFIVLSILCLAWIQARRHARHAPAVFSAPDGAPFPEYTGPLAFFRRHYNGDYSLPRSYWVNSFLVSLFAPLLGLTLLPWLGQNFPARYGALGFLVLTALGILAWCWATAGTWASAGKHVRRGGASGWAIVAKVVMVLGVLKTVGDVARLSPTFKETFQVAIGEQLGPVTKLELRADGKSLLMSGGINDGSAAQLEAALSANPGVSTVVLSSGGGWIREGEMLAEVIRKRGLNTYVEGYCASACTIAFLAGKERAAAPLARIGFHASRGVGSIALKATPAETSRLRAIYREAGLPETFITTALDTPSSTMWHPTRELLRSSGVVTRDSMGGETAAMSTATRTREGLAAELKKAELFALMAERYPKDFDVMLEAAWGQVRKGATDAAVMTAARQPLMNSLPRYLARGSDDALVAYQKLIQEEIEALRDRDVSACVEMAFPSGQPMKVVGNLPRELVVREVALITKVLRESGPGLNAKPDQQGAGRVAVRAASGMSKDEIAIFSNELVRNRSSPSQVCQVAIKFFEGLNAIPLAERGPALRLLYGAD